MSRAFIEMEVSQRLNERYKHTAERWGSGTGVAGGSATPEWASIELLGSARWKFLSEVEGTTPAAGQALTAVQETYVQSIST